jgi:hypothetical protein
VILRLFRKDMNEDENLCPQKHNFIEDNNESSVCSVWIEKMLDVYLSEQDSDEFIDHLVTCSRCQESLGICHQFVMSFDKAFKNSLIGLEKAQTANGGKR